MRTSTALVATAVVLLGGSMVRPAGQTPAASVPPSPAGAGASTQGADRAARAFAEHCAGCHGDTLEGARAASLLDDRWTYGGDDASLVRTIREGRADAGMPAFAGSLDVPGSGRSSP